MTQTFVVSEWCIVRIRILKVKRNKRYKIFELRIYKRLENSPLFLRWIKKQSGQSTTAISNLECASNWRSRQACTFPFRGRVNLRFGCWIWVTVFCTQAGRVALYYLETSSEEIWAARQWRKNRIPFERSENRDDRYDNASPRESASPLRAAWQKLRAFIPSTKISARRYFSISE